MSDSDSQETILAQSTQESVQSVQGGGNTKTPPLTVSASKHWLFTLNNYSVQNVQDIKVLLLSGGAKYILGFEGKGEGKTPHIQGYVSWPKRVRPFSIFDKKEWPGISWRKRKGSEQDNLMYCSKEGDWETNFVFKRPRELKDPFDGKHLYPWQQRIVDLAQQDPDDRTVHWFWEPNGNVGKSSLVKHLCMKHGALACGGKASDAIFAVSQMSPYPDVIIFDFVRSRQQYISYEGIESLKNGCCFSSKYESKMLIMNSPHVFCFANFRPDTSMLSEDRWNIVRIDGEEDNLPTAWNFNALGL